MTLSEFEIIQHVFKQQKIHRREVIVGIDDDAAVVEIPPGVELAISVDTLIPDVHFPGNLKPSDIGYRSLAVNLSDLAAMGAEPAWATLALTLPESNEAWLRAFASGFFALADEFDVQLIGGDTTRGPLSITVQVHGFLLKDQRLTRSGAQPGDVIGLTGNLGDAAGGLALWGSTDKRFALLKQRLARPNPRIDAGKKLLGLASSAIDISDGLLADLGHILESSQVGASIKLADLPLSLALCDAVGLDQAQDYALTGGDDYELCFTLPADKTSVLRELFDFQVIGVIEQQQGLRCQLPDGSSYVAQRSGYQHF